MAIPNSFIVNNMYFTEKKYSYALFLQGIHSVLLFRSTSAAI